MRGLQIAGAANIALGPAHGLQLASVNVARGLRGLQFSFGANWADRAGGVQLGAINLAGEAHGAQIGVVNVTRGRARGAQIGVINYADEADASLGVLGVTRKGGAWLDVWTSDVAAVNIALKLRARHTYTFLTAGVQPGGRGRGVMFGLGFGGTIRPTDKLRVEVDLATYSAHIGFDLHQQPALLNTLRLMVAYQLARRFAVFGGPTFNSQVDYTGDRTRLGYQYAVLRRSYASEHDVLLHLWPGFVLGVQI
jgi:hypothetical protein